MKWPTEHAASNTIRGVGRCKPVPEGLKVKLVKPTPWETAIIFKNDKIPEFMRSGKDFKGDWAFQMNGKKDQIYTCYPANGLYHVKFMDFAVTKGEALPAPQLHRGGTVKKGKDGSTYTDMDYQYMIANLKNMDGDYAGVTFPYFLRYYFKKMEVEGQSIAGIYGEGKRYGDQLIEFMEVFGGFDYGPMPYKDNLLPDIMKLLLRADKIATLVMKDGNPDNLVGQEDTGDLDDLDAPAKDSDLIDEGADIPNDPD